MDGPFGEGGGQILRTALSLSALTGKPFEIVTVWGHTRNKELILAKLFFTSLSFSIFNLIFFTILPTEESPVPIISPISLLLYRPVFQKR